MANIKLRAKDARSRLDKGAEDQTRNKKLNGVKSLDNNITITHIKNHRNSNEPTTIKPESQKLSHYYQILSNREE